MNESDFNNEIFSKENHKKVTWEDGSYYVGEWYDNNRHGEGKYVDAQGNTYIGSWKNDLKHGYGEYHSIEDHVYKGEYLNGYRHGQGTYHWPNGDYYDGSWIAGEQHGYGKYNWNNGSIFEGNWLNGKMNGEGTKVYPNGEIESGIWANDLLINKNDVRVDSANNASLNKLRVAKNRLIATGKKKGELSNQEIISELGPFEVSVELLDNFYEELIENGIDIIDNTENEAKDERDEDEEQLDFEYEDEDEDEDEDEIDWDDDIDDDEDDVESEDEEENYRDYEDDEIDWSYEDEDEDEAEIEDDEEDIDSEYNSLGQALFGHNHGSLNTVDKYNQELLSLVSIDLYKKNGFRILDLPVEATGKDVKSMANNIKKYLRMQIEMPSSDNIRMPKINYECYDINPDVINGAYQRLSDPVKRIIDEMLWFWNGSNQDTGFIALSEADFQKAQSVWDAEAKSGNYIALHNLAILALYRALLMENYSTKKNLSVEQSGYKFQIWRDVYTCWLACIENQTIWEHLENRTEEIDDIMLKPKIIQELKNSVIVFLANFNLKIAINNLKENRIDEAKKQIILYNNSGADEKYLNKTLLEKTQFIVESIRSKFEESTSENEDNSLSAIVNIKKMSDEAANELDKLEALLSNKNIVYCDLKDEAKKAFGNLLSSSIEEISSMHIANCENEPKKGLIIASEFFSDAQLHMKSLSANTLFTAETIKAIRNQVAFCIYQLVTLYYKETDDAKGAITTIEQALSISTEDNVIEILNDAIKYIKHFSICRFCSSNEAQESALGEVVLYRVKGSLAYSRPEDIEGVTVKIPRCMECKTKHVKKNSFSPSYTFWGSAIGLLLGFITGSFIGVIMCLLAGAGIGYLSGTVKDRNEPHMLDERDCKNIEFQPLHELLQEGWRFYNKE